MPYLQTYGFCFADLGRGDGYFPCLTGQQVEEVVGETCALIGDFNENIAGKLFGLQRHLAPAILLLYLVTDVRLW